MRSGGACSCMINNDYDLGLRTPRTEKSRARIRGFYSIIIICIHQMMEEMRIGKFIYTYMYINTK